MRGDCGYPSSERLIVEVVLVSLLVKRWIVFVVALCLSLICKVDIMVALCLAPKCRGCVCN